MKMDLISLAVIVSLLSVVAMFAAVIYILTYIIGSFSSRAGVMSQKFSLFSMFYFFGSTIFFLMGSDWVSVLARTPIDGRPFFLNIGASALVLAALLHISCGLLTAFLYLRGRHRTRVKV